MSAAPDARVALRARGVLEGVDLALRFSMMHFRQIARMTAIVTGPVLFASLVMRYVFEIDWVTTWSASIAVAGLLEGPFTVLAGKLALRADVTVLEVLRAFAERCFGFMLVLLASTVAQLVAAVSLLAPWLYVAPRTVFLPEVVLLEGGGAASFGRASRIVSGFGGRALALTVVLLAIRVGAVFVAEAALGRTLGIVFDIHARGESLFTDGGSPYALIGLWLSVPVVAMIRYVAYIDFRTLREGWDVQRRFQVLATRLDAEAAA